MAETETPAGQQGFVHEAGLYGSEDELLELLVPFVRQGVAAGEPTVLACLPEPARHVRRTVGDLPGVSVRDDNPYDRPMRTLAAHHRMFTSRLAAGVTGMRVVGQIPPGRITADWGDWVRYEAAVNHCFAPLPVRSICLYDTRTTAAAVLADVQRTHPYLWSAGRGHHHSPRYADPAALLADRARRERDPLERRPPDVELTGPSPATGRQAVARLGEATGLSRDDIDALELAVSETITNALRHGAAPVTLRAWAAPGHVVATVHDTGPGPHDPFAGLVPADPGVPGGHGLWVVHQLCRRATVAAEPDGCTVRLVVGTPAPPAGAA